MGDILEKVEFLEEKIFAHRGYYDNVNIPENSIKSFKKALKYDYNIELDVHLTSDNKIVVFHDYNLKRMCGINKVIEDCTYEELMKYNLLNTKCKIPLLSEVLNVVSGNCVLLIETKVNKFNGNLEKMLSDILDNYDGLFAIQSFSPFSIYWFKKHRKHYIRGLLSSDFKTWNSITRIKKFLARTLLLDIILSTNFISFDIKALPNKYVSLKIKHKTILGWTVRNEKDYIFASKYCDNVIAEDMNKYVNIT